LNQIFHQKSQEITLQRSEASEEELKEIFRKISAEILRLILLSKPKKEVFLAVDGVAPRAKANLQRSRRFRKDKEQKIAKELFKKHDRISTRFHFNRSHIQPGTRFMRDLQ